MSRYLKLCTIKNKHIVIIIYLSHNTELSDYNERHFEEEQLIRMRNCARIMTPFVKLIRLVTFVTKSEKRES